MINPRQIAKTSVICCRERKNHLQACVRVQQPALLHSLSCIRKSHLTTWVQNLDNKLLVKSLCLPSSARFPKESHYSRYSLSCSQKSHLTTKPLKSYPSIFCWECQLSPYLKYSIYPAKVDPPTHLAFALSLFFFTITWKETTELAN